MELREVAEQAHQDALAKGWWSQPTDTVAGKLLLVHSEVSEAAECLRDAVLCSHDNVADVDYNSLNANVRTGLMTMDGHATGGPIKPVGFMSELADIVIRVFDIAERIGGNIETAIQWKMEYNRTRSQRHGGKLI